MTAAEKRGIVDAEKALKKTLIILEDALGDSGEFLNQASSQEPDLGDLYVYGVLRGLEGLGVHDLVMNEYSRIPVWYKKMRSIVEERAVGNE